MLNKPEPLSREFTGTVYDTEATTHDHWVTGFYVFMVVLLITVSLLFWRYNHGDIGSSPRQSTSAQTITPASH